MVGRIALAAVIGIVTWLLCVLVGGLLLLVKLDGVVQVGHFLQIYGPLLGVLAGVWYFFSGKTWLHL